MSLSFRGQIFAGSGQFDHESLIKVPTTNREMPYFAAPTGCAGLSRHVVPLNPPVQFRRKSHLATQATVAVAVMPIPFPK